MTKERQPIDVFSDESPFFTAVTECEQLTGLANCAALIVIGLQTT